MALRLGEVVKSKAGRDAGRFFVVKDILDGEYVHIVDGDLRKTGKPKKKKRKHIEATGHVLDTLVPGFKKVGRRLTDAQIKKALNEYMLSRTDVK